MAKKSQLMRSRRPAKYRVRAHHRCQRCGRARAYFGRFGMCRICVREMAVRGLLPGVTKASW